MITLENGHIQNASSIFVPYGSISFSLNVDATVIAAPGGFVCADIPIVFQLDANGNLIQPCQIWSNEELQPQLSSTLLGTYYRVQIQDRNGAALSQPMWWQFPEAANSVVDISQMTPVSTVGGVVIFYPTSFGGSGTVTSVTFTGDGTVLSATPSTPVTTSGTIAATLLTQNALTFLAGPTTPGPAAAPTFRTIVSADIPVPLILNGSASAAVLEAQNPTAATALANHSSPFFAIIGTYWTGAVSATDSYFFQNVVPAGSPPSNTSLTLTHSGVNGSGLGSLTIGGMSSSGSITTNSAFGSAAINGATGLVIQGTTAASGAANVSSGLIELGDAWWDGAASNVSLTKIQAIEGTGTNPTDTLVINNSGAFAWGGVSVQGKITATVLQLTGASSGTATITPPAVAGTVTNPVTFSNAIGLGTFATGVYSTVAGALGAGYSGAANLGLGDGTNARRIPMTLYSGYSFGASGDITSFTSILGTPTGSTGSLTLVAHQQTVGSTLHVRAVGTIVVSTASQACFFRTVLNTGICAQSEIDLTTAITTWEYDSYTYCSAVGAANTATMQTVVIIKAYSSNTIVVNVSGTAVTSLATTVDTTASQLVDLQFAFGAVEAGNTIQVQFIEVTLE